MKPGFNSPGFFMEAGSFYFRILFLIFDISGLSGLGFF
jgi:hypothetical protein